MSEAAITLEAADIVTILKALPHRYPFLMVDRIISMRGDEAAIGIKNVTINEPQFLGHFPGNPVFPGVLMIEGMAQTAGAICILSQTKENSAPKVYFLTIDKAKFRKLVLPGDTIEYHMRKMAHKKNMWWFRGKAIVAGQVVAEAEVGAMLSCSSTMALIDPTARIESGAMIGQDVSIGPYCIIGPDVSIGDGCRLLGHIHFAGHSTIGARTVIYPFASLGTPPQSLSYRGEATRLIVGTDCDIRQGVTMNTGTAGGRGVTEVGDRGFFMAYSHIGHDCRIGNDVVFANNASLAGHCVVGDHVFMAGLSAAHQFTRIGAHAMISGVTALRGDVIPFGMAAGAKGRLIGINAVGMKRRQFSPESIWAVRTAYRRLFFGEGVMARRLEAVEAELGADDAVARVIAFVREARNRPLCYPGNRREV